MSNDRINLALHFMNSGTIPPSHGEGVVYRLTCENNVSRQVWLCHKEADGQYDDEGRGYLQKYPPYYILTYFPTSEVQEKVFEKYMNEDWFDYDEALINKVHQGSGTPDYVGSLPICLEPACVRLPYLDWYIEKGHIYAEGEGITRELVEIVCEYNDESGVYHYFHLYVLSRSEPWNWSQVANLISSQDSKLPLDWRNNWLEALRRYQKTIKITVNEVYVLDGRDVE